MFKILKVIVRIGKRSNTSYIGVNFVATSSNKYYIYAADLSQILITSYYLRVYI